jgi:N-acetylneuraminic acid mutarotase
MRRPPRSTANGPAWPVFFTSCFVLALLAVPEARAHFLWLTSEREGKGGNPVVHAFLSETPLPEGAEFLKHIAKAKITAGGHELFWTKGTETYQVNLPSRMPPSIEGFCDLGVMKRDAKAFRLLYTARVQFGPVKAVGAATDGRLWATLISGPDLRARVLVRLGSRPVAGAVVKVYPEDKDPVEIKTDAEGYIDYPGIAQGQTGLLAKWTENMAGKLDDKAFDEIRHYTTLTVDPAGATTTTADVGTAPFAVLPEAINSFGGAVLGDWLYVYSGHTGATHKYHTGTTSPHFRRLNLKHRTTWEDLPCGPSLQGVTLVANRDQLYRVGGMSARQKPGEPDDLVSTAEFARFDTKSRAWTNLPPLPAPRSTHDAVVVGDKLYVVGGWSMRGGDSTNAEFLEDALVFDLSTPSAQWEKLPVPSFRRRALAVGAIKGKIYVLGGLEEDGNVVKSVAIYDPKARTWSEGPELPGSKLQGFAPSAFEVGEKLYVSGADGLVHRLSEGGDRWEVAGRLAAPRITHRLLPGIDQDLLAVGGNFAGVPVRFVESIPLADSHSNPKVVVWSVPLPGEARQGQALALAGSSLLAFGGNRSPEPHAFAPANLLREGTRIAIGSMAATPFAPLAEPRQSAALLVDGTGRKRTAYLLGGIGPDEGLSRTLGDIWRLNVESGEWAKLPTVIPDGRGMFGATIYKNAIWVFGGSIWDPRPGHATGGMPDEVLRWDLTKDAAPFEASGARLPRKRRSFAGTVQDSKYFLVGGLGDDMKPVAPVDVFDFETKTWSSIAGPPNPRLFADLVSLDGKLYLAGGFVSSAEGHFEPSKSIEVYDPASNGWTTLMGSSPVPHDQIRMMVVQGRLLLVGWDREGSGSCQLALVAP